MYLPSRSRGAETSAPAAGPRTLTARCISVDAGANVLVLDDLDPERLFATGGQLVIATPFDSNEVALSYFSLDGAMQARNCAREALAKAMPQVQLALANAGTQVAQNSHIAVAAH